MGSRRQQSSLGMHRGPGARVPSSTPMAPPTGPSMPPGPNLAAGATHERLSRQPSHHNRAHPAARGPGVPYHQAPNHSGALTSSHLQQYPQTHAPHQVQGVIHVGPGGSGPPGPGASPSPHPLSRTGRTQQKTQTARYWDTVLDRSGQGPGLQRQDSVPLPGAQQSRTYSSSIQGRTAPVAMYPDRVPSPGHGGHHLPAPSASSGTLAATTSYPSTSAGPSGFNGAGPRRKHKCPHCEMSYETKLDVRWHISQEHKSKAIVDKYPCKVDSCDKVFTHRVRLEDTHFCLVACMNSISLTDLSFVCTSETRRLWHLLRAPDVDTKSRLMVTSDARRRLIAIV